MDHFERFLADYRPDVINFHHVMGFGVQALRAARRALGDVPIVYTLHEYLPICANHGQMIKTRIRRALLQGLALGVRRLLPRDRAGEPDAARAVHQELPRRGRRLRQPQPLPARPLRRLGPAARASCVMIENGLDGGEAAPPRPVAPGGRRNRFAFFGQLNPFKGIRVLVDAVTRIPSDVWGDSILYIYGGNLEHQPEEFQAAVKELFRIAGRRLRFMGSYKSADLPSLMREVDWTIVPSTWWENAPVVIQEAFFHGRPIITSDIGGMAEKVRDGIDGLHFRAGNPESLAEAMAAGDPRAARSGTGCAPASARRPPRPRRPRQHAELFERLLAAAATGQPSRLVRPEHDGRAGPRPRNSARRCATSPRAPARRPSSGSSST